MAAKDTYQERPFGGPQSMRKRALKHHAPGKMEKRRRRRRRSHRG